MVFMDGLEEMEMKKWLPHFYSGAAKTRQIT